MSTLGLVRRAAGSRRTLGGSRNARPGTCAALVVAALLINGCASAPKPTPLTGELRASANINPSVSQRPSPLLVRVYELKSATAFNSADFVSLYQNDQATLGAEMVAREEITLNPKESRPWARTASPETRFIGVLGAFRDLDHAKWRSVLALQPGQRQRVVISADTLAIAITAITE